MTATVAMRRRAAQELQRRYGSDPVRFADEVLGLRLWDGQRLIMEATRDHPRVAVRSGHKTGKTTVAAAIAIWRALFFPKSDVVVTSVKSDQIDDTIWKELKRLYYGARYPLGGTCNDTSRFGLKLDNGSKVYGRTSSKGEGFAGISGTRETLLFIVDEASGIREEIFEVIEGNRAGGAGVLLTGNPTQPSGSFYDAFHGKADLWRRIHISSLDTPNVRFPEQTELHRPGLASLPWVEEKRREWAGTPAWDVRVAGDFPKSSPYAVVGLGDVERAKGRWTPSGHEEAKGPLYLGVDVARFGDDRTVIQPLRGHHAYPPHAYAKQPLDDTASAVMRLARELRRDDSDEVHVMIDGIGLGAGVVDMLGRSIAEANSTAPLWWLHIHDVCGQTPDNPDEHADLRTQLWFGAAAWLRDSGALPEHGTLEGELVAAHWKPDARGRPKLEPKDATKRRIGRSPDHADALCLACYRGQRFQAEAVRGVADHLPRSESARLGRFF